ncbi:MAG: FIST N-terminal domain-containing protein [Pseudomonadota bacterium]
MKTEQRVWKESKGWQSLTDNKLKDKAQLVFLFGSRERLNNKEHFAEVKGFYPNAHIAGCSTSGEIIGTEVQDDSLVVTAVFFEKGTMKFAHTKLSKMDESFKAGQELARSLEKEGLVHVLVLSDGLGVNGSELVKGLVSELPNGVAATGGLAGDKANFKETSVFLDGNPEKNIVVAIGFYGSGLKIGYGSQGGWTSFGLDRLVTKSKGNVLYELDGQPALELYKKFLGDQSKGLPATGLLFPLSLRIKESKSYLVRTILAINEDGGMVFAGDIPEGAYVRLMKANFDRLVDGALGAANMSLESGGAKAPDLAILISCVGRKLVLKQKIEEEIEGVKNIFGEKTAITGFYSYGEICPAIATEKRCELHNQTMTITTFSES